MKQVAKISKVAGPPGTGKTTYLLGLVAKACERYDPERIGCVSYTNSAVETIKERISFASGISHDAIQNTRTLHSHCFRLLDLKKDTIADTKIKEWNEQGKWELPLNNTKGNENEAVSSSFIAFDNRKIFQQMQILRNRMIPPDQWPANTKEFYNDWTFWMSINGYTDFIGMLEQVNKQGLIPNIDILFVDESQDLSLLQLSILRQWAEQATSTLYVGDSDQAIFRWAGASPDDFINLEHDFFKALEQSYRVPKKVHEYARRVILQSKHREDVPYAPTDDEGRVIHSLVYPDLSLDGTHMILARCGYQLNRWKNYLISEGIPWHNDYRPSDRGWNPTHTKGWEAVLTYLKLKNMEAISGVDLQKMIKKIIVKGNLTPGIKTKISKKALPKDVTMFDLYDLGLFTEEFLTFKKPIHEVFILTGTTAKLIPRMTETDIAKEPRITLGTIHSSKGGEADHVWLDAATSSQCMQAIVQEQGTLDDEIRVAYVGVTRAKQTLGLMASPGIRNPVLPG